MCPLPSRAAEGNFGDANCTYAMRRYLRTAGAAGGLIRGFSKPTDPQAAAKNKAASLTLMRRGMIDDAQAAGLVVIGGRTTSGGHSPGVDEEIWFARKRGLAVFFVGSAGGRAAELCAEMKADGWRDKPNSLSVEDNEELLSSLDHGVLANKVLDALGL